MSDAAYCSVLRQLLDEELACSSRLLDALRKEETTIAARDPDALSAVVAEKDGLLAQMESSHKRRTELMQQAGASTDAAAFSALVASCGDGVIEQLWSKLRESLQACQRQNNINGRVLESSRRNVQRALAILLGGQPDGTELYNQHGRSTTPSLGGRQVTKA